MGPKRRAGCSQFSLADRITNTYRRMQEERKRCELVMKPMCNEMKEVGEKKGKMVVESISMSIRRIDNPEENGFGGWIRVEIDR